MNEIKENPFKGSESYTYSTFVCVPIFAVPFCNEIKLTLSVADMIGAPTPVDAIIFSSQNVDSFNIRPRGGVPDVPITLAKPADFPGIVAPEIEVIRVLPNSDPKEDGAEVKAEWIGHDYQYVVIHDLDCTAQFVDLEFFGRGMVFYNLVLMERITSEESQGRVTDITGKSTPALLTKHQCIAKGTNANCTFLTKRRLPR